ncbi:protein brambleberry [Synchiropus splendidus]|uniref:protein brambleberry n=1 Tax=Synchiropus splendidus TaxID=270530 RepID=UPI00237E58BF|nr:protein brambleberry [Synchiropus splendidus]
MARAHLFLLLLLGCSEVAALFDWLRTSPPPAVADVPAAAARPEDVPFEMVTADEKLLAEAKQMQLSELDSCHVQVVARLRASCHALTEEQMAKLGVELFNCQARIEGRRTFPCSDEMGLRECTADMDSDTWNAYHIVSNRARAVCYAARQQLFRRRAEETVNALISSASSQLGAMQELKEGQLELRELTAASLDKLVEGHGALQRQQVTLQAGQEQMEDALTQNLQRLGQEKALIASGQELVAQLIQGVTQKMEFVSENLQLQGSEVQENHKTMVQDLAQVWHQVQDIHQKIDHSMSEFQQYQDHTSRYYSTLMSKLERMNSTLALLLDYLDHMHTRVEERLHWIQGYLGLAGLSLAAMWVCISHAGYFLLCAVLLTFLRCAAFTRAALLMVVPVNALAKIHQQAALDLGSLTVLLLALSLGADLPAGPGCYRPLKHRRPAPTRLPQPRRGACSESPEAFVVVPSGCCGELRGSCLQESQGKDLDDDLLIQSETIISGSLSALLVSPPRRKDLLSGSLAYSTPRSRPAVEQIPVGNLGGVFTAAKDSPDFIYDSRSSSPTPSLVSNSSLTGRQLCNGVTKTGKACKKRAVLGKEFCCVHEDGRTSYIQP